MRAWYIDNAKAIGIILVVVGHHPGLPRIINEFIFSFHMPLFFFLSGYLLKESHLRLNFAPYLRSLGSRLLLPYLFFSAVSYAYWLLTFRIGYKAERYDHANPFEPLWGVLYGINTALDMNVVLWFFTCMFMVRLIYFSLRRLVDGQAAFAIAFILGIGVGFMQNMPDFRMPWNADLAIVACVFYAIGHQARYFDISAYFKKYFKRSVMFSFLTMACLAGLVQINGRVDMAPMNFGKQPLLFFAGAFMGIYVVLFLSTIVKENGVLLMLSKYSIVIFPLHLIFFSIFNGFSTLILHYSYDYNRTFSAVLLQSSLAIGLCLPISFLMKRFMPKIIPIS